MISRSRHVGIIERGKRSMWCLQLIRANRPVVSITERRRLHTLTHRRLDERAEGTVTSALSSHHVYPL